MAVQMGLLSRSSKIVMKQFQHPGLGFLGNTVQSIGNFHTASIRLGFAPIKCSLGPGKEYKWCACGLSKKQPFCDGSHKTTNKTPIAFKVSEGKDYFMCVCKQSAKKPYCDGTHKKL